MADMIPLEGLQNLLKMVVASPFPLKARLFTNVISPDLGTSLSDLTEATFSGYAPQTLDAFTPPVDEDGGVVRSQVITVTFAHNGGPTAEFGRGYYVTHEPPTGSELLWLGTDDAFPFLFNDVASVLDVDVELLATQEV